jgi:hypothetical protein
MSPYSTSDSQIQAKTPPTSAITPTTKQDVISVSIGDLTTSNYQPRKYFAVEAMESLMESIRKNGILQPTGFAGGIIGSSIAHSASLRSVS